MTSLKSKPSILCSLTSFSFKNSRTSLQVAILFFKNFFKFSLNNLLLQTCVILLTLPVLKNLKTYLLGSIFKSLLISSISFSANEFLTTSILPICPDIPIKVFLTYWSTR